MGGSNSLHSLVRPAGVLPVCVANRGLEFRGFYLQRCSCTLFTNPTPAGSRLHRGLRWACPCLTVSATGNTYNDYVSFFISWPLLLDWELLLQDAGGCWIYYGFGVSGFFLLGLSLGLIFCPHVLRRTLYGLFCNLQACPQRS